MLLISCYLVFQLIIKVYITYANHTLIPYI